MQDVCTDAEMLALLERAKRGEPAAYDRLYNLYADRVFRYLYARLGQREVAEDLTADVFVRCECPPRKPCCHHYTRLRRR